MIGYVEAFAIENYRLKCLEQNKKLQKQGGGYVHYYLAVGTHTDRRIIEEKIGKVHVLGKTTLLNYAITFVSANDTLAKTTATVYPKQGNLVSGVVYGLTGDQMDKVKTHKMTFGQIPTSIKAIDSYENKEYSITLFVKDEKTSQVVPSINYVSRMISLANEQRFPKLYISYLKRIRNALENMNKPKSKL